MTIAFLDTVHPVLAERLTVAGHTCLDLSTDDPGALAHKLHDVHGIVVRGRVFLDHVLLDAAKQVRFIARAGAGMENIDRAYCARRGITLYNSPEGNRDAVAEHALGMLLALMRRLVHVDREVRAGTWDRKANTGHELNGSTVGIIGYGQMGSAFAQRLRGFGVRTIAYDKYRTGFGNDDVEEVTLDDVLEHSDTISLHLPLTGGTHGLVDAAFLERCAKPVRLINTARGPIVDTTALLDAVDAGRVLGACLDVLDLEERSLLGLRSDPQAQATLARLRACDRVLLSPHIAGITHESYFKMANILADKVLQDIADGEL